MKTDFFNREFNIGDLVLYIYAPSSANGYARPVYTVGKVIDITLKTCMIRCKNSYDNGTFDVRKHHNKLIILSPELKLEYTLGKKIVNEEWT